MFQRLGIAADMKDKARASPNEPVAAVVARGDAEIGFQQISEMLPVPGVDIVGPLPPELQKITVFAAGIATVSKEPDAGKALIKFLASPAARNALIRSGLEPIDALCCSEGLGIRRRLESPGRRTHCKQRVRTRTLG